MWGKTYIYWFLKKTRQGSPVGWQTLSDGTPHSPAIMPLLWIKYAVWTFCLPPSRFFSPWSSIYLGLSVEKKNSLDSRLLFSEPNHLRTDTKIMTNILTFFRHKLSVYYNKPVFLEDSKKKNTKLQHNFKKKSLKKTIYAHFKSLKQININIKKTYKNYVKKKNLKCWPLVFFSLKISVFGASRKSSVEKVRKN